MSRILINSQNVKIGDEVEDGLGYLYKVISISYKPDSYNYGKRFMNHISCQLISNSVNKDMYSIIYKYTLRNNDRYVCMLHSKNSTGNTLFVKSRCENKLVNQTTCIICMENLVDRNLACGHSFCTLCLNMTAAKGQKACPCCRTSFDVLDKDAVQYSKVLEEELSLTRTQKNNQITSLQNMINHLKHQLQCANNSIISLESENERLGENEELLIGELNMMRRQIRDVAPEAHALEAGANELGANESIATEASVATAIATQILDTQNNANINNNLTTQDDINIISLHGRWMTDTVL